MPCDIQNNHIVYRDLYTWFEDNYTYYPIKIHVMQTLPQNHIVTCKAVYNSVQPEDFCFWFCNFSLFSVSRVQSFCFTLVSDSVQCPHWVPRPMFEALALTPVFTTVCFPLAHANSTRNVVTNVLVRWQPRGPPRQSTLHPAQTPYECDGLQTQKRSCRQF